MVLGSPANFPIPPISSRASISLRASSFLRWINSSDREAGSCPSPTCARADPLPPSRGNFQVAFCPSYALTMTKESHKNSEENKDRLPPQSGACLTTPFTLFWRRSETAIREVSVSVEIERKSYSLRLIFCPISAKSFSVNPANHHFNRRKTSL